jgi:threonine dehydratase
MPWTAELSKISNAEAYGAAVLQYGHTLTDSKEKAFHLARTSAAPLISPTDDPDIVLGQGTVMLEFIQQIIDMGECGLDVVILPCGGGGLLAGAAIFAKSSTVKVLGSEPQQGGPNLSLGIALGERITTTGLDTIADGLRSSIGTLNWSILSQKEYVPHVYTVTEEQIKSALKLFIESSGQIIEPSSAVPLAVVLYNRLFYKHFLYAGSRCRIGIVLSGANITTCKKE